ncbi:unnamed protein product [Caenorhabditis sp. 36 PRJEB53466]|nr:unnamed protein product [Caenorhabditis sp. 36 PRJEB53466]
MKSSSRSIDFRPLFRDFDKMSQTQPTQQQQQQQQQPEAIVCDQDQQPPREFGGIEGPNSKYVKLVSSDDHEFIIKRELALTSGTIRAMLSGPGVYQENESNVVYFREIPSHVLQKVCQYFAYKVRYTHAATEIPEFPIPPEVALELLMAANFLDC